MSSIFFLKRIFFNKAFWLSVATACLLLFCSVVYTDIEILEMNGKNDAVLITIDDNNFILLREGSATIDCKKIGKKEVFLVGATGKEYRMIAEQLEMGTFRF